MTDPVRKGLPFPDGAVSCVEWESGGPLFHFAHATGFNAETYRSLLAPLAARFRVVASDARGHGFTTLPATLDLPNGWTVYRDDLLRILDVLDGGPAILCGHSMGATVSLMAAALRPVRLRALVLLEPVMIPRFGRFFRLSARGSRINPSPNLADRAARRRDRFASFDAALAAYTGRGAFKSWPTEMLSDYLKGGLVRDASDGTVRLACAPAWEAATFRAAPYGIARLARRVSCPIVMIRGTIASMCFASEAALFERGGARVVTVEGASHFLPMEYPGLVRDEIKRLAETL
ncbi:MAG: alpha/beta fold hydrolase [Rhizomicrobium sp.]